jgi:hypothetical protein
MHRVSKRILNTSYVRRYRFWRRAHGLCRDRREPPEAAIYIDPQKLCVDADVTLTKLALLTFSTDYVGFRRNEVPFLKTFDAGANFNNPTAELMTYNRRRFHPARGPLVPLKNVKVCSAYGSRLNFDFDVTWEDCRFVCFDQFKTRFWSSLGNGFHRY